MLTMKSLLLVGNEKSRRILSIVVKCGKLLLYVACLYLSIGLGVCMCVAIMLRDDNAGGGGGGHVCE